MKKTALVLLALISIANAEIKIADDKFKHAYVGIAIYAGCLFLKGGLDALNYDSKYITTTTCLIPVVVAGVGKEIYDANTDGHVSEWQDAFATMAIPSTLTLTLYEW